MTEILIKLASAIAEIDGGCSNCITSFLGRSYMIESYDFVAVVNAVNKHLFTPILISEVQEIIDNLRWSEEHLGL